MGDVVRIIECRPLSKLKRWQLGEVVRKAVQVTTDLSAIGIQTGPEQRALVEKAKQVAAASGSQGDKTYDRDADHSGGGR